MNAIRWLIPVAVIALATACSGSGDEAAPGAGNPPATGVFSLVEIGIDPNGWIAMNNFTDVEFTLDGLHLCQGDDCFALPDVVVAPDQTAYVATGRAPEVDGVVITGATVGTLRATDGEIAVFLSDPGRTDSLVDYLEWGSTPHSHTQAAVRRGLWIEGSYAPSSVDAVRLYRDPEAGLWLWEAG